MFKKFLGPAKSIGFAAGLVAFFSILSRVIGVLRDRILAGQFGAGNELDAYYAAFRVPDLIFNLVVLGALSAGFIPIFTRLLEKQNGEVCETIHPGSHGEAWLQRRQRPRAGRRSWRVHRDGTGWRDHDRR